MRSLPTNEKRRLINSLVSVGSLLVIWSLFSWLLSSRFDVALLSDRASAVFVFGALLPIQLIFSLKTNVHWSQLWMGLGLPIGMLGGLIGVHTNSLNMIDYRDAYPAMTLIFHTIILGGLISGCGYFARQNLEQDHQGDALPLRYFPLVSIIISGLYLSAISSAFENFRFSPEALGLIVATIISAFILRKEVSARVAAEATLFGAMISVVVGLIFWFSDMTLMVDAFESMNFIHSGLEYSLLLYVHLYLFSFCRPQLDGIDPGRFNWHWLEVVAFFIFMLWAPETIRETLKNAENDGLEEERDGKLDDWKKDLDRRVRELENKK